jgi:exopolysaccharide biosynthesis WecB/TagA/CpsF family protein
MSNGNSACVQMLNVMINNVTKDELLQKLDKGVLVTPNVDHLIKLQKDKDFYDIYTKSDWVVCDSKVLYFYSKLFGLSLKEAIPGSSFFTSYYEYHKQNDRIKIFLLGAADGVAENAARTINDKVGREIVVGFHSPSFGFEKNADECEDIVQIIKKSGANVVLVGVGAPKQEKWIFKYKDSIPTVDLWLALGATIDFEAGNISRAPLFMQKIGMEWFYRMFVDPKRLIKRYLIDDLPIFWLLLKQRLGFYKNPFE